MKAYIANAARFIALFLSGALILSVLSCDMSVNSAAIDNPAVTVGEPAAGAVKADPTEHVTGVTITVSKEKIPSNGSDAVYITATATDAEGKNVPDAKLEYFAHGKPLDSPVFFSPNPGFYNLYAYSNGIRSNVIEVQVLDSDVARVTLYSGLTTIAKGQRLNTVVNAYRSDGNRSSRKGDLYADGVKLDERVFVSDKTGLHILYAVVQKVQSPPFAVLVTEGEPPDATLTLGAPTNYIKLGEEVSFITTLTDGAGKQLTNQISDCELYKIGDDYKTLIKIKDGKFKPDSPGKHYFVATCRGIASRVLTLSVTDPDAPTYLGEESDVPVIVIDTHGQPLSEDYNRVTMYVYDTGEKNKRTDKPAIITEAEIRWRGQSSLGFPKKQFALHTITYNGANNNIALLGLPKENDWVLNGSYADKSLVRNGLAYELFGLTCGYAPRTKYCEVYINSTDNPGNPLNYQGVYSLIEKIKVDKNRVNIDKLTPDDNSGDALTGGYIVAIDKFRDTDYHFSTEMGEFVLSYPSAKTITDAQRSYITKYINDFISTLHSDNFTDPQNGYRKYLDVESTVRHLALTELLRDVDGFIISTYFYKPRNGLLYAGPAWDYDLTLGNADYNGGADTQGWYVTSMPLSRHLLRDPYFKQCYVDVWKQLRSNLLGDDKLLQYIDDQVSMIGNALPRSMARWPEQWDGRTYIWPNLMGKDYRATHEQEIIAMKKFILTRAKWIDKQIENASW